MSTDIYKVWASVIKGNERFAREMLKLHNYNPYYNEAFFRWLRLTLNSNRERPLPFIEVSKIKPKKNSKVQSSSLPATENRGLIAADLRRIRKERKNETFLAQNKIHFYTPIGTARVVTNARVKKNGVRKKKQ